MQERHSCGVNYFVSMMEEEGLPRFKHIVERCELNYIRIASPV